MIKIYGFICGGWWFDWWLVGNWQLAVGSWQLAVGRQCTTNGELKSCVCGCVCYILQKSFNFFYILNWFQVGTSWKPILIEGDGTSKCRKKSIDKYFFVFDWIGITEIKIKTTIRFEWIEWMRRKKMYSNLEINRKWRVEIV